MATSRGPMKPAMNRSGDFSNLDGLTKFGLWCLTVVILNIVVCSQARGHPCAYPDFQRVLKDFIRQQKEHQFSVVYTQCLDITSNGRIVLVFPLTVYKSLDLPGQHDPMFDRDFEQWPGIPVMLDYDFNGCIDNIAKLQANKSGFFISEVLSGGMGTVAELHERMNKMLEHSTMHYLPPDRIGEFITAKPDRNCAR